MNNENTIKKNVHKIKKLDSDYKKNYISDLKRDAQSAWDYWERINYHTPQELQQNPNCMRVSSCNHAEDGHHHNRHHHDREDYGEHVQEDDGEEDHDIDRITALEAEKLSNYL